MAFPNTFAIRGVTFEPFRSRITQVEPGKAVELVPEPDNEHDPNAIKVVQNGVHFGYIPRELTEYIHPILGDDLWGAHVVKMLKDKDSGDEVGATVMFFSRNHIIPRQESRSDVG